MQTNGHSGNHRSRLPHERRVESVLELRVPYGPGYRLYFAKEGETVVILLCGGDKATQRADIARAKHYWREHRHARG